MHDLLPQTLFYIFAGLTVFSAIMVVTQNNPVRCVLFLVLAFFLSAVLWILVQAEFLALILVLVYVGAVMTLFLFVVMMLNIDVASRGKHFFWYLPLGLPIVALLTGLLFSALPTSAFKTDLQTVSVDTNNHGVVQVVEPHETLSNTEALGMVLYTNYVFAFELAAVILLVSIIAAITLVHRQSPRMKRQNVVKQIMTRSKDRVTLIKMKAEKR